MSKESQMTRMQMTNGDGASHAAGVAAVIRHSSFGFLSTFDFRHSTFPARRGGHEKHEKSTKRHEE